jgi:hypothetical protein
MLLAGCGYLTSESNWSLVESGYSLDVVPYNNEFAMRVHVNELRQLGGDIHGARFALYVTERLRRNGLCPAGWEPLPCTLDGSCVSRSHTAVKIFGRCLGQAHLQVPVQ